MVRQNDLTQIGASAGSRERPKYSYRTTSVKDVDLEVVITKVFRNEEPTNNYQGYVGTFDGHVLSTFHGTTDAAPLDIALDHLRYYRRDHANE